jgi:hypothetical protein
MIYPDRPPLSLFEFETLWEIVLFFMQLELSIEFTVLDWKGKCSNGNITSTSSSLFSANNFDEITDKDRPRIAGQFMPEAGDHLASLSLARDLLPLL